MKTIKCKECDLVISSEDDDEITRLFIDHNLELHSSELYEEDVEDMIVET